MQQSQFTDKAKTALILADKCAKSFHQNYVGTEHILLGLLRENTGVAARVLQDNGADEKEIVELIHDFVAPDVLTVVKEKDGYSPRALAILEESHKQAQRFHSDKTGTEHILMAIIKEGENVAARLINTLGIQLQKLYSDLLVAMGEDGSLYKEDLVRKNTKKKLEQSVLSQYSRDLTKSAREGKLRSEERRVGKEC